MDVKEAAFAENPSAILLEPCALVLLLLITVLWEPDATALTPMAVELLDPANAKLPREVSPTPTTEVLRLPAPLPKEVPSTPAKLLTPMAVAPLPLVEVVVFPNPGAVEGPAKLPANCALAVELSVCPCANTGTPLAVVIISREIDAATLP
jgi:hypothetical protein